MNEFILEEFQYLTEEQLRRNAGLPDLMTKLETTGGKINRAVSKAMTHCGCIRYGSEKPLEEEHSAKERAGIGGDLCETCREEFERAVGEHLFYLAGLLGALDISLYDMICAEISRQKMIGKYSLR